MKAIQKASTTKSTKDTKEKDAKMRITEHERGV